MKGKTAVAILLFVIPLIAATLIYNLFRQDLSHARSAYKLKRGALEALIQRHHKFIYAHLAAFGLTTLLSFVLLGAITVLMLMMWGIVFMGHLNALNRFSIELIKALTEDQADTSRLVDYQAEENDQDDEIATFIHDQHATG